MNSAETPSPSFEVALTSVRLPIAEMIALARRCHVRELSSLGPFFDPISKRTAMLMSWVDFEPDAPVGIYEFIRLADEFSHVSDAP